MDQFLKLFQFEHAEAKLYIATPFVTDYHEYTADAVIPADAQVYFTPALRRDSSTTKESVVGTTAYWCDIDDPNFPRTVFPPSIQVFSGHGWHLYWLLEIPDLDIASLEKWNKTLSREIPTADKGSWNANRVLRVPDTLNTKYNEPIPVELKYLNADLRYSIDDFQVIPRLSRKVKHKIRTGDRRGYHSRSERDWAVITGLVQAGASDRLIYLLFEHQPIGDKYKDPTTPAQYLAHTIEQAREKTVTSSALGLTERPDGYVMVSPSGEKRLSTFVIRPSLLLDGSQFGVEDALVGRVQSGEHEWHNVTFTRTAFTTVRAMDKECPLAAWQWLGNEASLRNLLPYLMTQLAEQDMPRVIASNVVGLHFIDGVYYFIGDSQVLSADSFWEGFDGPVGWLPAKREHPTLNIKPPDDALDLQPMKDLLPQMNAPCAIWPILGWYAASCVKPWLEAHNRRFPILNVTGEKGSGKTTILQRVMMPLFGQTDPKSYDAGTTKFVTLTLLGVTNAVPIAFSEFRYDSVEKFLRFVLLAYDTGHDPRGRADQTTVDYPLTAPYSIDGEDIIADPAARERILAVELLTETVKEGGDAYAAFVELRKRLPHNFAGFYLSKVLRLLADGDMEEVLQKAVEEVFEAIPTRLPDRVRNNLIVARFGMRLFTSVVGMDLPPAEETLKASLELVYDVHAGRSRVLIDDLVEDVINRVVGASMAPYQWSYLEEEGIFYFQFAPAHNWWLTRRRSTGRSGLERDALRMQLRNANYYTGGANIDNIWMYGIDLAAAFDAGLDVPQKMPGPNIRINLA